MTTSEDLQQSVRALMPSARADLERLVAMRSAANAGVEPLEECLQAARYTAEALTAVGLKNVRLLDMPFGHSAVFGEAPGPAGAPTVLLYSHYDVQPPLGDDAWRTPAFELTEKDGRWYG